LTDKSPRQQLSAESSRLLKPKRADKQAKAADAAVAVPPTGRKERRQG